MTTDRSLPADPAPYFEAQIFVCTNDRGPDAKRPSCARAGSEKLRDYMKAQAAPPGWAICASTHPAA